MIALGSRKGRLPGPRFLHWPLEHHRRGNPLNIPDRTRRSARIRAVAALLFGLAIFSFAFEAKGEDDVFSPLKGRLLQDGFSRMQVASAFQARPAPQYKIVAQTFRIRESKLNYDQFLAPPAIARAQRFIDNNRGVLSKAEEIYGVDRRVITAILLVETQFGGYTGKTPTLAVLATFAVMDRKPNQDRVWTLLPPRDRERWGREGFDNKLAARSSWAYRELCALLRWSEEQNIPAASFNGSVMGAVGWSQFLPSSMVRFGVDGNRDGRIDLFDLEDAVFSVGNYLRGHGWNESKTRIEKEEVIYCYNKSRPYVQTILGVADRLRK